MNAEKNGFDNPARAIASSAEKSGNPVSNRQLKSAYTAGLLAGASYYAASRGDDVSPGVNGILRKLLLDEYGQKVADRITQDWRIGLLAAPISRENPFYHPAHNGVYRYEVIETVADGSRDGLLRLRIRWNGEPTGDDVLVPANEWAAA